MIKKLVLTFILLIGWSTLVQSKTPLWLLNEAYLSIEEAKLLLTSPVESNDFFRYAEIPDIVFAEGYPDSENMGIYMLNPDNLYPKGGTEWLSGSGWSPQLLSLVEGNLPAGVTFDPRTGRINYDGSNITGDDIKQIRLKQSDTNQVSELFNIKVLKIDQIFDGTSTLKASINKLPSDGEALLLIKNGNYSYENINVTDSYVGSLKGKDRVYIIGEPGEKPKLNVALYGKQPVLTLPTKNNNYLYYKNLDIARVKLNSATYTVFNDIFIHDQWGADVITQSNIAGQKGDVLFLSNIEMTRCGSDGVKHCLYLHGVTFANDGVMMKKAFINNLKAYQMVGGGKVYGGITIKSLTDETYLRNFFISQAADYTKPDEGTTSKSQPVNFSEFSKVVVFNGEIHSNRIPILFSNRNIASAGNANPKYHTETLTTSRYPLYEGNIIKNAAFHGENSNFFYSTTGDLGDVEANINYVPVNAPFWDSIGDVTDPLNTKLPLHKFISFVEFHVEEKEGAKFQNVGVDMRGTAPKATTAKFRSMFDRLPAPPNWQERSHLFAGNNKFYGYKKNNNQVAYKLDFEEPIRYVYPYAPDALKPRTMTHIGGDTYDDTGSHIKLPSWFKI